MHSETARSRILSEEGSPRKARARSGAGDALAGLQRLNLPLGLIGFEGRTRFVVSPLADRRFPTLRLLRSIDEPGLSFVVAPVDPDDGLIDEAGIREAQRQAGIGPDEAGYALLVSVRCENGVPAASVNLCAPLVIDRGRGVGRQVVLSSERYPLRYPI